MERIAEVKRTTAETDILLKLNLDPGLAESSIDTGVGFLNHMLTLFAKHGSFELQLTCHGDNEVDDHHSTEDIGIALGKAFAEALGDKRGIHRYASIILPMDEALVLCAVDLSGRGGCYYDVPFLTEKIGTFDTQLVEEFMRAFAVNAGVTLHLKKLDGINSHHVSEACFKALGHAMKEAVAIDPMHAEEIPSTKGTL